jgi:hypothetical protein
MKTIKNAPFYLVIVAVINETFKHLGHEFIKGDQWVVDQSQMRTAGYDKADEVYVIRKSPVSFMGYNVFKLPENKFSHYSVKTVIPKFKVGDIVMHINGGSSAIPSRISSYSLSHGSIWYQDEWGDSQGLASGNMEEYLRLATPEEIKKSSWALERKYTKV